VAGRRHGRRKTSCAEEQEGRSPANRAPPKPEAGESCDKVVKQRAGSDPTHSGMKAAQMSSSDRPSRTRPTALGEPRGLDPWDRASKRFPASGARVSASGEPVETAFVSPRELTALKSLLASYKRWGSFLTFESIAMVVPRGPASPGAGSWPPLGTDRQSLVTLIFPLFTGLEVPHAGRPNAGNTLTERKVVRGALAYSAASCGGIRQPAPRCAARSYSSRSVALPRSGRNSGHPCDRQAVQFSILPPPWTTRLHEPPLCRKTGQRC
jgi:hypothetical protein